MSKTIAELEEEIRYTQEGIEQMGEAWDRGEYKGDNAKYGRDVKNNERFIEGYQKKIDAIKENV